jgi:hypothetical protein
LKGFRVEGFKGYKLKMNAGLLEFNPETLKLLNPET